MDTGEKVLGWVDFSVFFGLGSILYGVFATWLLKRWSTHGSSDAYKAYKFAQTPVHFAAAAAFVISCFAGARLLGYGNLIEFLTTDASGDVLGVSTVDTLWLSYGLAMLALFAGLLAYFAIGFVESMFAVAFFLLWVLASFMLCRAETLMQVIFISAGGFIWAAGSLFNMFRITPVRLLPINVYVMIPVVLFLLGLLTQWLFTILVCPYMQIAESVVGFLTVQIIFSGVMAFLIISMSASFILFMRYRSPYDRSRRTLYPDSGLVEGPKFSGTVQNRA
jgi:hypothetical protein